MKNGGELGELADLEQQACEWIRSLQRDHGATATPLPEKMREHLGRVVPVANVVRVRVRVVYPRSPARRSWWRPSALVSGCSTSTRWRRSPPRTWCSSTRCGFLVWNRGQARSSSTSSSTSTSRACWAWRLSSTSTSAASPPPHHSARSRGVRGAGPLRAEPGRGLRGGRDGAHHEAMERRVAR
jgi:hypothetical protein